MAKLGEKKENPITKEGSVCYLWVTDDVKNELIRLAQKLGKTLSAILREAIDDYLREE